jgi:type VI secretion system secreted protein VgrG
MSANVGTNNMPIIGIANLVRNIILAAPFTWNFNRNFDDSITTIIGVQDYPSSILDFGFLEKTTVQDTDSKLYELKDVKNNEPLGKSSTKSRPEAIAVEGFGVTPLVPTLNSAIKTSFSSPIYIGQSSVSFTVPQTVVAGDTLAFALEMSNGPGAPLSISDSLGNTINLISSQNAGVSGGAAVVSSLSTAANYAILAAAGITNSGATLITGGNIGSFPTTSITGFTGANFTPPATTDNTHAAAALTDALTAYNYYTALSYTSLSGSSADLSVLGNGANSSTYIPGNYSAGSSMDIPTSITLDAQGNTNAIFVFKAGSTLTLESGASILLANGAQADNIVWIVGSSAGTIGTTGVFNGNILANTSISLGGGTFNGRALAGIVVSSGAVTIATAVAFTVPPIPLATDDHQFLVYNMPITVSGTSVITINAPVGSASLVLSQVAVSGTTVTYTGTIIGGSSNALVGQLFTISGFTNVGNNVSLMTVTASTPTTLTGTTTTQVNESHTESASSSLVLTQVTVVGPTTTYTGTITGGASNGFAGQIFPISGFATGGNNVSFLVTSSTSTTLVGTTTTQVNETHSGAAPFTLVLSQVSVSGTTVTYTGTITGGTANSYNGQTFVITGFTNSGNNVSLLVTASTATTLTGTTTTQVNESHFQSAASSLNARNFVLEGVLLTGVGPIQLTSYFNLNPVNNQGVSQTWTSEPLTTIQTNEILLSFTTAYAPPSSVTDTFTVLQSMVITDSTAANVQLSTAAFLAPTIGVYNSHWTQASSAAWQAVLIGYPTLPGLANTSPIFRFSAVPDKAYPVDLIYQKKPIPFLTMTDSWAPIPDSFSDVYNNLCLGYFMDSCQDGRAPQYIARGVAGLIARAQGLSSTDKAIFASAYMNFNLQQILEQMRVQQGTQAQGTR